MDKQQRHGRRRKGLVIVAGGLAVVAGVFMMASFWVSSLKLPEELKRPPMELPPPRSATTLTSTARPQPPVKVNEVKDYADFLRARIAADPGLSSATVYLELAKRLPHKKTLQLSEEFRRRFWWKSELSYNKHTAFALTPEDAAWLRGQAVLLKQFHRLARIPSLPAVAPRERLACYQKASDAPRPDHALFELAVNLLVTEGRLRRQQGNHAGARESFQATIRLAELYVAADEQGDRLDTLARSISRPIAEWVEDPKTPDSELASMLSVLERADEQLFPKDRNTRWLIHDYLQQRAAFVREMERGSWRSRVYGWDVGYWDKTSGQFKSMRGNDRYCSPFPLFGNSISIPRLDRMAVTAIKTMNNKRKAVLALKLYDDFSAKLIEKSRLDYPRFATDLSTAKVLLPTDLASFKDCFLLSTTEDQSWLGTLPIYTHRAEAEFRLSRLGAQWRLDRQKALKLREGFKADQTHHIWRDPFTEKPFRVNEQTSSTLLYSLAPDLTDEQGAHVNYPRGGILGRGDFSILVP